MALSFVIKLKPKGDDHRPHYRELNNYENNEKILPPYERMESAGGVPFKEKKPKKLA